MKDVLTTIGRSLISVPVLYYYRSIVVDTTPGWVITMYSLVLAVYVLQPILSKLYGLVKGNKKMEVERK